MITPGRRQRHTELRPKRWGVKPAPKAPSWRDEYFPERRAPKAEKLTPFERSWLAWVRTFDCIACGAAGPSQAAHQTLSKNEKGTGMKVDHTQAVPLCLDCHDDNDGRRKGRIFRMSQCKRFALRAEWVRLVRDRARPDGYSDALALQAAGLGTVVGDGDDWSWLPGDAEEGSAAA